MARKDYYEILGVNRNASQDEIKKAFKQLARKWHPDVNKENGSEEKFKEVNEAFQVLGDQQKKTQYDQFGTSDFNSQQGFSSQGFNFNDIFRNFGFDDLFEEFGFNNRREREESFDIKYDLEITLEDAFKGLNTNIEVPQYSKCNTCDGSGAKPGFLKECKDCEGTGEVRKIQRTVFGQVVSVVTCSKCGGDGSIIIKECEKCEGKGKIKKIKKVEVNIPKGVDNGQYLRIPGDSGNIYITINIKKHDIFDRDEADLYCKTTIDLGTAILGGEIDIPTISGKAKLNVPSGTQSYTVFRLKGQGMPNLNSSKRGDQLVKFIVNIPDKLNKKQENLIKEIFSSDKKVETKKGFFDKLREFI